MRPNCFRSLIITGLAILATASTLVVSPGADAQSAGPIVITLENDTFTPAEITVPAGKPFKLKIVNKTVAAIEFEAKDLKIEKVMPAKSDATVSVRPMPSGRYLFVNEYKEDKVKGYIVVK